MIHNEIVRFLITVFTGGHVREGTRITGYLARRDVDLERPGCTISLSSVPVSVSASCEYFPYDEAFIPIITVCSVSEACAPTSAYSVKFGLPALPVPAVPTPRTFTAAVLARKWREPSSTSDSLHAHHLSTHAAGAPPEDMCDDGDGDASGGLPKFAVDVDSEDTASRRARLAALRAAAGLTM